MKKFVSMLLVLCVVILSSCSNKAKTGSDVSINTESISYGSIESDWTIFPSAQELVDESQLVFTGKVTDISFQMLDGTTGYAPTEKTEEINNQLYTFYDIEIITLYKGEASKSIQVAIRGGIMDYREDEQLTVMGKYAEKGIPISEEIPKLEVGETYLLALGKNGDLPAFNLTPAQSIYNLYNPFIEYRDGYPSITVKSVISTFGKDKWDDFWIQWQKDNPDWETRLDKEAVERALAEE